MIDREKTARAAEQISRRTNSVITEVIDKDEDTGLTLPDRSAAALAAIFVCAGSYFAIWLLIEAKTGDFFPDVSPGIWL